MKKIGCISIIILVGFCGNLSGQLDIDTNWHKLVETEKMARAHFFDQHSTQKFTGTAASTNFDINFYRCHWKIDPDVRHITGQVNAHFTITNTATSITYDLSDTLIVDSVYYHGQSIGFQRPGGDALEIVFPSALSSGKKDSVAIYYRGVPRNRAGFGAFVNSTHAGVPVMWTLSEPYGSKEWWPCKNGLDDKADSIDITITTPLIYRGTTNGVQYAEDSTASERTVYFKHRYPITTYLVAIAATNYILYKDSIIINGKLLPLISYVYPETYGVFQTEERFTKQSMEFFNKLFGEYPFVKEKYGHTQFGWGGGMEHQTNSFVAWPYSWLIAHELGHQWFGDKITCATWEDIWLNEGFASYLQFLFGTSTNPNGPKANLIALINAITARPDGAVKVSDTTNASRIFDTRLSYQKGLFLVHMLRGKLGDSAFFRGVRQYVNDPALIAGFARTADLQRHLEKASGKSLTTFFNDWYEGEGYPDYSAKWYQNSNNWARVELKQTSSHPSVSFFEMPVQLRFKNASKDTIISVEHDVNGKVFWINVGFVSDSMFIDPDLWILSKTKTVEKIQPESLKENHLKIFPNPAPDFINILIQNPRESFLSAQLFNSLGQLVYQQKYALRGADELFTIATSPFARGVYTLRITNEKKVLLTKKIIR